MLHNINRSRADTVCRTYSLASLNMIKMRCMLREGRYSGEKESKR